MEPILPPPPPSSSLDQLDQEFSEEQLDKLHRLSALTPPPLASQERALLKSHLAAMLRLVKGVSRHQVPFGTARGQVDARPLTRYDASGISLCRTISARRIPTKHPSMMQRRKRRKRRKRRRVFWLGKHCWPGWMQRGSTSSFSLFQSMCE